MTTAVLGVDIGTSSSKATLVTVEGTIIATAVRVHAVDRPEPSHVEMNPGIWWSEFVGLTRELLSAHPVTVAAVGVSGMGPCVALADSAGTPVRPAILYGVDTRATAEILDLTTQLGAQAIINRCGSALSTQAVGPKIAWLSRHEPDAVERASRLFMPSSWLVWHLTGQYVLDHHSASQCTPLYDTTDLDWYLPWTNIIAPKLELPRLLWPGDIAGAVTAAAAMSTGLAEGTPVIAGTIDAWTEAVSVDAQSPGDLMLMYGTTMFLVNTVEQRRTSGTIWGTVGAFPGTYNLAAGMATSGAITQWLRDLVDGDFAQLTVEADAAGPGGHGLLMLPYFAGERTPIADPWARGVVAGLSLETTRGDLYRAALEATAFGVRHNLEALRTAGGSIERVVAVGGGTQGGLWTQLVSDITGLEQEVPSVTVGASFGAAYLAASSLGPTSIAKWNPPATLVRPRVELTDHYERSYLLYRSLYEATAGIVHELSHPGDRLETGH